MATDGLRSVAGGSRHDDAEGFLMLFLSMFVVAVHQL